MSTEKKEICLECPLNSRDEWRARGAVLRMEMRRHDLKFREMMIAELILDKTYGWNRAEVVFPQLRIFTEYLGIEEPDVTKVLKTLHARRVIRIITVKGQPTYSINGDSESWKAMPRVSRQGIEAVNALMREINGMPPLQLQQEAALNFKNRPHAKNFAAKIGELPMVEPAAEQTAEFPNLM